MKPKKRANKDNKGLNFMEATLFLIADIGARYGLSPDESLNKVGCFMLCRLADGKSKNKFNQAVSEILDENGIKLK